MKNKNNLISIIIPVYNVENYLDRCLESVVGQTYTNIEILLIDDGSTDGSGAICDRWREKDSRIRVIHKNNGGLSSARNTGIDNSRGSYLIFIDSDDWVDRNMLFELFKYTQKGDLICSGLIEANDIEIKKLPWFSQEQLLNPHGALDLLIENKKLTSHVPPKLYKKYLFNTLRFPEGKVFEDVRIQHKLFLECKNKIVIVPQYYYYYYSRSDSISREIKLSHTLEWFEALKDRLKDLEAIKNDYKEIITSQMAVVVSLGLIQNSYSREEISKYKESILAINRFLRNKYVRKCVNKHATKNQYMFFLLARVFSYRFNIIYRLLKGVISING